MLLSYSFLEKLKKKEEMHRKRRIEYPQETGWNKRGRDDTIPMEVDKLPDMVIAIIVR